jgi:hypothetical protein
MDDTTETVLSSYGLSYSRIGMLESHRPSTSNLAPHGRCRRRAIRRNGDVVGRVSQHEEPGGQSDQEGHDEQSEQ